ncbi:MAG: nucleotide-binding universal stress UspA family protein/rubrerythrin [Myxococcota bacterium]|jgi:nucleotide-binding universal stress UspA family protein/rubrerythrin
MYSKIAVPVEPGNRSRNAAVMAHRLSETLGCEVLGLQVDETAAQRRAFEKLAASLPPKDRRDVQFEGADLPPVDVPFGVEVIEGRPHKAIEKALADGEHDLLVLRAVGEGENEVAGLGPVAERLLRTNHVDTLIVKTQDTGSAEESDTIMVCMDGSPQAFAGLKAAFELGRKFNKKVEAAAVYDPYLHYTLFNGIVGVLSAEASSVFKFADQEKLHEEIIDTGLAKIYQAHLDVSMSLAREDDVELSCTLLDGKAFQKLLRHAARRKPWLMVLGRIGVHSEQGMDIGATTENLLRHAPCNVLVTSRTFQPPVDVEARANVEWTPEAEAKMKKVPSFVVGVATTAILRWAKERGHSIITASVINSAMGHLLPAGAARAMGYDDQTDPYAKGEAVGMEVGATFVCANCGHVVRDIQPPACGVCSSEHFEVIDRAAAQATNEAMDVEETFDGRRLGWTSGAKSVLRRVPSGYQRRRSKARIEKSARVRGLDGITEAFAIDVVEQDLAETSYLTPRGETLEIEVRNDERADDATFRPREESELLWTDAAWARLERVPPGFMREMTRTRIEQFVDRGQHKRIALELCEEGIAEGRRMMAEALVGYDDSKDAIQALIAQSGVKTEVDAAGAKAVEPSVVEPKLARAAVNGGCPVHEATPEEQHAAAAAGGCPVDHSAKAAPEPAAAAKCPVDHSSGAQAAAPHPPAATTGGGCPVDHGGETKAVASAEADPEWTAEATVKLEQATERATQAGKFTEERAEELSRGVAETRAREKMLEKIGSAFMGKLGNQLGYGHPLAQITSELAFEWTPEAEAELDEVPAFCREMTKWRVEWTAHKKGLGTLITREIMAIKYDMWGEVSDGIITRGDQALEWDDGPAQRMAKIPGFVKGQVVQSVEGNARRWGFDRVTDELLDKVIQQWIDTGDFHEGKYGYK